MKISELREKLAELEKLHGDVEVMYEAFDTRRGTYEEPIDVVDYNEPTKAVLLL
ncbi:hypothetical protein [Xanthomonas phage XAJ2]|uniref:Uncharacterized protein n=1 Tax=Xanthomonas phage XAJ2 TaxID=1775249 RepID=A0A1I9L2I6_9CAUD|nr:hypothetical protein [Xanthomonas phage XAJ2]